TDNDDDRCSAAVENLLNSPLLGGRDALRDADAMIATVVGGDDFTIGEMKQTLDIVRGLSGDQTIITAGVNSDPALHGKLLLTVVAVQCEDLRGKREALSLNHQQGAALTGAPSETASSSEKDPGMYQPVWIFQSPNRGYFSKTAPNPVKLDDEDVDMPTFQRKNIIMDKGF
ncbi:MAG: hypothetical protein KAG97_00580, partial [Victivallales bacterium]|nr:hypothetical protein [Victivallales bacterium]